MLSRLVFKLSRRPELSYLVRWGFSHNLTSFLPIRRLVDNRNVIAFYHPHPSWKTHVLIIPKRGIASILAIEADQIDLIKEILVITSSLVARLSLSDGYVLVVNGGAYQEVGQLHFHLGDSTEIKYLPPSSEFVENCIETEFFRAFPHPMPIREKHIVIQPKKSILGFQGLVGVDREDLMDLIVMIRLLAQEFDLSKIGFSLLLNENNKMAKNQLCLHLVSGHSLSGTQDF